jgi:hypothetical protein
LRAAAEALSLNIISQCNRFCPPTQLLFIRNLLDMERISFKSEARFSAMHADNLDNLRAAGAIRNSKFSKDSFLVTLIFAAEEVPLIGADAMAMLSRSACTDTASASSTPQAFNIEFRPSPRIASDPEFRQFAQI